MCEVLDRIEQRGIEQGIEQGIESGTLSSIRNLMDSLKTTAQQAMDLLKIPEGEQEKYLSKL